MLPFLGSMLLSMAGGVSASGNPAVPPDDPFCFPKSGPPILWCQTDSNDSQVPLEWLVQHAAPILWFSPDEPLLQDHSRPSIPRLLPETGEPCPELGDLSDQAAAVYWQIDKILTVSGQQPSVWTGFRAEPPHLPVRGVDSLVLHFFFYYPRDYGLNPHCHDLEGVEFQLDFQRAGGSGRVVLARVTGLGHGSALMSNILQVRGRFGTDGEDVRLPVTILVEEGKHASCPDRNGDGHYTPSYDVNVKVADAWGVRDIFGQGVVTSRYNSGLTKPRVPEDRIGPRPDLFDPGDPFSPYRADRLAREGPPSHTYALRRAPRCDTEKIPDADRAVCAVLRGSSSGESRSKFFPCTVDGENGTCLNLQESSDSFHEPRVTFFKPRYTSGEHWWGRWFRNIGWAGRLDGTEGGLAASGFLPWGLPFGVGGWFTPRGAVLYDGDRWRGSVDLSYSPSISRLADWYAAVGYDWNVEQASSDGAEQRDHWSLEAGLQVRIHQLWIRTGVRAPIASGELRNFRLVAEVGIGPW